MPRLRGYTLEDLIFWQGSQAEAARKIGVSESQISRVKNTVPSPYFMAKIAKGFDVELSVVMKDYEKRKQSVRDAWLSTFDTLQKR